MDLFFIEDNGAIPSAAEGGVNRGVIQVFANDGTGHFTNVTVDVGTDTVGSWMGITFGDFDHNGRMDFFATDFGDWGTATFPGMDVTINSKADFFFYQREDGTFFQPPQLKLPFGWGASAADFDNDGNTDVAFFGGLKTPFFYELTNPGVVLRGDRLGEHRWAEAALPEDGLHRLVHGVATGDLDRDGFVDIVNVASDDMPSEFTRRHPTTFPGEPLDEVARILPVFEPTGPDTFRLTEAYTRVDDGSLQVLINQGGTGNHWIEIRTLGAKGILPEGRVNRDGIGAVIKVTPKAADGSPVEDGSLIQPVLGGGSHAAQDSLAANFGLGSSSTADVEILWPGGTWNKLSDVRAGERILLPEIPCDFKNETLDESEYIRCVTRAVNGLRDAGIVKGSSGSRLLTSALEAFRSR